MNNLKDKIREVYTQVVKTSPEESHCCGGAPTSKEDACCKLDEDKKENGEAGCGCSTAEAVGCGTDAAPLGFNEDYSDLPGYNPEADYGLGCGIPVAFAGIEQGHTVLDLGSGAGNDVFVARSLVGEKGKVIGVDITSAMIEKAISNKQKLGYDNVEFILGDIENLPIPERTVDVVISNCVLNLVSDKLATYRGIYKTLKPQGHFSISDVVVSGELTEKMQSIVALFAGCIAGAMVKDQYIQTIKTAGFKNVNIKKEKTIHLPDNYLLQYLSQDELEHFRKSGVEVLSITINGSK